MNELTDIQKSIVTRIHRFCDDLISGQIPEEIEKKYNIPSDYIAICNDPKHPSSIKLNDRLFQYIMARVGYYNAINDIEKLETIEKNLDEILEKGGDDPNPKPIIMHPMRFGIKKALESIASLTDSKDIDFNVKSLLSDVEFSKESGYFSLKFNKPFTSDSSIESLIESINKISIDGKPFEVLKEGLTLQSRKITFTHPDEISLVLNKFQSVGVQDSSKYYFRYITEIEKKDEIDRRFGSKIFDLDGYDIRAIETKVKNKTLLIYVFQYRNKNYLIFEYIDKILSKEMFDLCFSVLVSYGMITKTVHLNDGWLVAYDAPDMQVATGVLYRTWIPTVHCDYEIFTTNVYPRLVAVGKRCDAQNGEKRMLKLIERFKCFNLLLQFPPDVFGSLVENMMKYEELQRGIFIVLMGSHYNLEVQAAIYCVAMEAISNLYEKIIGKPKTKIVANKKAWDKIRTRMNSTLQELLKEGIINTNECGDFEKKVNDMNKNFNSEKLKSLLLYFNYPLTNFDNLTLHLRNPLLHGSIIFDKLKNNPEEDNLFQLSLNLHKLCCATALLMSGFKGYIVNNRNFYGYPNSGSAFIKIGNP